LRKKCFLPTKKVRGRDFNINVKSILFYDKKFENNDFYIKSGINLSSFDRIIFNEKLNLAKEDFQILIKQIIYYLFIVLLLLMLMIWIIQLRIIGQLCILS